MSLVERIGDLAAAIRDKLNLMMPRLLPAGGAAGHVLTKTASADYAAAWAAQAAGAITWQDSALTEDVLMTDNNEWYSGPSLTLPAGTWLILASGHYRRGSTTAGHIGLRIWDGTQALASAGQYHSSVNVNNLQLATQVVAALAGETTVTLQMANSAGAINARISTIIVNHDQGNTATRITAIRLA